MASIKYEQGTTVDKSSDISATLAADTSDATTENTHQTDPYMWADVWVQVSGTFTVGDVVVDMYLIRRTDTATEEDQYDESSAPFLPANAYIGSIQAGSTSSAEGIIPMVPLPPEDYKMVMHNRDDGAFTATNLKWVPYRLQTV